MPYSDHHTDIITITITTPTIPVSDQIASVLLEKKLVACAQRSGPIYSSYVWQGKIHEDQEYLLTLKTVASLYHDVEQVVLRWHPYEVPQITAHASTHLLEGYQSWVKEACRGDQVL